MTIDYKAFEGATPGPWSALPWEKENGGKDWNVWGPQSSNHIHNDDLRGDFGSEADARLIAAAHELLSDHKRMSAEIERLREALTNAAATIGAIYEWVGRIEKAGGATSISGVAACHAMLKSLRKNADRTDKLIMQPVRAALASSSEPKE